MSKTQIRYQQNRYKPILIRENILSTLSVHQTALNNRIKDIKKDYGIFFTPERIVDFMINLINIPKYLDKMHILEPACGLAQFLIGLKRNQPKLFKKVKLLGVEMNQDIIDYFSNQNILNNIKLIKADYLLWEPNYNFDLIIGNPPYGIPSLSSHYTIKTDNDTKETYKNMYETWYGKYNIYGAFIEKSIKLLRPEGQLIFIVPATFMILDEFKKLRSYLAKTGRTSIIYLGPDIFKPEAYVASVVLNFFKSDKSISCLKFLEYKNNKLCPISINHHWQGEVVKFETNYTRTLESCCSYLLGDIYDFRISPRTPEIKHNSLIIRGEVQNLNNYLPLLNGRNLKCKKIIYDNLTGFWIKKTEINKLRGYFDIPHIVVGLGFRENGKVAAAIDEKCYPWMGDIYHLVKKDELFNRSFDMTNTDIIDYLNSDYLREYIRDVYREITYHLSITQLKNIPLPTKKEWQKIERSCL